MSSFEFKISEEINRSVESDGSDFFYQFNYCDSTSLVEDILAFAYALDGKCAEQKESIRQLQFNEMATWINMFKLVSLFHELEPR